MSQGREVFDEVLDRARERRGVALMGICNVTPDSFSDGGLHNAPASAHARVDEIVAEGADIVDVGPESTRPGAPPVSPCEQLRRALDVVRYAASIGACVSIDTASPEVAEACLAAGASVVNDTSCLADFRLARVAADRRAALVLMHSRGLQAEMTGFSQYPDAAYGDVVNDVLREWGAAADRACSAGLHRDALVMDPGLGFSKNARQSHELLSKVDVFVRQLDVPILIGASRKSFLARSDPDASPRERIGASIAAVLHAVRQGVSVVRVHDVRATRQAIDCARQLEGG
ncbi:MAG: dihydropteroate synthase [Polyangiaceae bacterium]